MFSNGLPCNLPFPSCLGVPKDSGSDELLPAGMGNREPVILNVYDMVSWPGNCYCCRTFMTIHDNLRFYLISYMVDVECKFHDIRLISYMVTKNACTLHTHTSNTVQHTKYFVCEIFLPYRRLRQI